MDRTRSNTISTVPTTSDITESQTMQQSTHSVHTSSAVRNQTTEQTSQAIQIQSSVLTQDSTTHTITTMPGNPLETDVNYASTSNTDQQSTLPRLQNIHNTSQATPGNLVVAVTSMGATQDPVPVAVTKTATPPSEVKQRHSSTKKLVALSVGIPLAGIFLSAVILFAVTR